MQTTGAETISSSFDPIRDLFRKIFQQKERESVQPFPTSFLFLLQHSTRLILRIKQHESLLESSSNGSNSDVYRRAGLMSPWETAWREFQAGDLWMQHAEQQLLATVPSTKYEIVRVSTIPDSHVHDDDYYYWKAQKQQHPCFCRVRTVTCWEDPWGWVEHYKEKQGTHEEGETSPGLDSLEQLFRTICGGFEPNDNLVPISGEGGDSQTMVGRPCLGAIVFSSLVPLIQRHGFARIGTFLRQLQRESGAAIILVPILTDSLTTTQHQQLEDLAQSVLILEDGTGQATWLHQGVRERANLVRHVLPYDIVIQTNGQGEKSRRIQILKEPWLSSSSLSLSLSATGTLEKDASNQKMRSPPPQQQQQQQSPGVEVRDSDDPTSASAGRGGSKKTQLSFSDDGRSQQPSTTTVTAPAVTPQIFVQDDDPEFDDYDEEDPDDDLDI